MTKDDAADTEDGNPETPLWRRLLVPGLLVAGLIAFFVAGGPSLVDFEALGRHRAALADWVGRNPVAAPLAFAGVYAVATAFSLPVGAVMTVAGGLLLGRWIGTLAAAAGATVGAIVVFLAARHVLSGTFRERIGRRLDKLDAGFRDNAFSYLLVLRLVPLFPFWLVNVAPALAGVVLGTYVAATAVGILPGTFVFASVGEGLDAVLASGRKPGLDMFLKLEVLLPIAGLIVLALVPVAYRRYRGHKA